MIRSYLYTELTAVKKANVKWVNTFLQSFLLDGIFAAVNIALALFLIYPWWNFTKYLLTYFRFIFLCLNHSREYRCEEIDFWRIWLSITTCRLYPQTVKLSSTHRRLFNGYSLLTQSEQWCTSQVFFFGEKRGNPSSKIKQNDSVILTRTQASYGLNFQKVPTQNKSE